MNERKSKLSIIIIAVGLIVAAVAHLFASVYKKPTVTEHTFEYSVTYKLEGETKTLNSSYICRFEGFGDSYIEPTIRCYGGEYTDHGLAEHAYAYTVAQKDGFDICIVTCFNAAYLMNDPTQEYYEDCVEDPYVAVYDAEGAEYSESETVGAFNVEIVDWVLPEPIENSFTFDGFAGPNEMSMIAMTFVGFLTLIACVIFVKKSANSIGILDKIGALLNFATIFVAFPVMYIVSALIQTYPSGPAWIYLVHLCVPQLCVFTVAASVALRRNGYSKSGFFIQFAAPILFLTLVISEFVW